MSSTEKDALPAGMSEGRDITCNWCGSPVPVELVGDREMEGCCSLDCRYQLARDEGFVTDTEHEQYVAEGWAPGDGRLPLHELRTFGDLIRAVIPEANFFGRMFSDECTEFEKK